MKIEMADPAASVFTDSKEVNRDSNKKAYRDLTSQNKSKKKITKGFEINKLQRKVMS